MKEVTLRLPKIISKRYFAKAKILFGVNSVEEYRRKIDGIKDEIQRDGYFKIPNVKAGLSYDTVGSII